MKNYISFVCYGLLIPALHSQPALEWQHSYGGSYFDEAKSVQQINDGGYIVAGFALSNNGDVNGNHGGYDYWVLKLNNSGGIQWKKAFGGSDNDWAYSVQQTIDSGFVIAGLTQSDDGHVTYNHGDKDCWVVKVNNAGVIQWQKSFGGSNRDEAWCVRQCNDSGFVIAGKSSSVDGDVTGNHGGLDYWVVKMSDQGNIEWQKSLGGALEDIAYSIRQTIDGGYIVAGESGSVNGDVSGNHGSNDLWVVKLTSLGEIEWQKSLGSNGLDRSNDIIQTSDGGYVVVGEVSSNTGDVTGHHGGDDFWVAKLNTIGELQWQKALGGSGEDYCKSVLETSDGNIVVVGTTQSMDGDVLNNDGGQDIWIVKLTGEGAVKWQKTIGGSKADWGSCIQQTSDDGFIISGYNWSNDGDATTAHGYNDYWIVKLFSESVGLDDLLTTSSGNHIDIYPNPANQSISLKIASEEPDVTVSITDLLGRQLSRQTIPNGGQTDVSTLPNGLYIVVAITQSGKVFSNRIWKE